MEREKIISETKKIASLLEAFGNLKIEIREAIIGREFSAEERDILYFSAIKDNLGLVFKHRPEISPLLLGNILQGEEMFGPKHIYFTIQDGHLDRNPTEEEIREHYKNSRASRFRKRFDEIMGKKSWSAILKMSLTDLGKTLIKFLRLGWPKKMLSQSN